MLEKITLRTAARQELVNVTDQVKSIVARSAVTDGMCYVFNPHSTAGLTVNSYLDPNTPKDIVHEIDRLVPTRYYFFHANDTPSDAAAHVKTTLTGLEMWFFIADGALVLGRSQGILFAEFDGPRNRELIVKVIADR